MFFEESVIQIAPKIRTISSCATYRQPCLARFLGAISGYWHAAPLLFSPSAHLALPGNGNGHRPESNCSLEFPNTSMNLANFGGVGDGATLNTTAFSNAIASLSESGGGELIVPPGFWLTGSDKVPQPHQPPS